MTPPSDEVRLLAAVRGGDESAFRTLYRRHNGHVYAVARRLLGARRADADDVVQEAWLRAVKGLATFRGESQFSTWVCGIAIRCALEALRQPSAAGAPEAADAASTRGTPDLAIDLESAIAALADGYRTVLVLHDVEGRTHAEIAALLGIDQGTSKSQLSRARHAVRIRLHAPSKERA
jgi:RNA polymerase sigma factor (sigma-70 family)